MEGEGVNSEMVWDEMANSGLISTCPKSEVVKGGRVCFSKDLAQCVNEVKRDNEILRQITTFQLSIENMVSGALLQGISTLPCITQYSYRELALFPVFHSAATGN